MLRALDAAAIVASIADAAERWSDADFPPRVRATDAIVRRTAYSAPVVEYALDRLFVPLRRDALAATIADELGSLAALDGPVARTGRPAAWARGVDRVAIVSSDTTIGVALVPAVFALCAKCDVHVKDRSDELIAAFFASLRDERSEFGAAAVARAWSGGAPGDDDALVNAADVVVAFGRDATLAAIRDRLPADTRFVAFGHRVSIGAVDIERVTPDERAAILEGIAADALLYDGEGCLSLHALFAIGSPSAAAAFAADLAAAFERAAVEFPEGPLDPSRAAAVAAYRNLGAFRAAAGHGTMFAVEAQRAAVAYDPPADAPPPLLPRVLPVYPVASAGDIERYVRAHGLPVQAVGVPEPAAREWIALAAAIGAVRVARFGTMQAPPLGGHHGGAPRIADFVRWIDCE
ncbi:MAG: acyl-CoA reductase [Candidatus Velthaea sp.]